MKSELPAAMNPPLRAFSLVGRHRRLAFMALVLVIAIGTGVGATYALQPGEPSVGLRAFIGSEESPYVTLAPA